MKGEREKRVSRAWNMNADNEDITFPQKMANNL